ncbi:preprotein translocase YidC [Pedobacter psychrophilus]|uniref:Membrane protein insertase YidC n=1 Tax=Pedobacter psychrophilus TaxID=1826909 RepID=A0A179DHA6_9SPHI|nr:membrane protein insertase YidC [Pedobacter psychrophilus]OAQ39889.1 preprotein translocase YidC [Pedobacter psychrophilus]
MDRNTFTGLFLILVILVGSTFLLKPSSEDVKKEQLLQDSLAKAKNITVTNNDTTLAKTNNALTTGNTNITDTTKSTSSLINEEFTVLENKNLKVLISNKGGKIASVEVKNETTYQGKPLILFTPESTNFGFEYKGTNAVANTTNNFFNKVETGNGKVVMQLANADGSSVQYTYTLSPDSHQVGFRADVKGFQNIITDNSLVLDWNTKLLQQEKDIKNERMGSTTYYQKADGTVDFLSESKDEDLVLNEGKTNWISFKEHFFSAALIPKEGFSKADIKIITIADSSAVKAYAAKLSLPYKNQVVNSYEMNFYFGSNKFSQLKAQGHDLEQMVKMGWGPLKWINRFLVLPIFNFFESLNLGYGLIILLLTLILKSVLFPFTYKSYLSMAKMRVLKPEMDEIKKKVGEGNQALVQQEYLKLYKQAGVNPLGGCLPLVFQMPFILAFFYFFPNLFELRHESFLWMKDLSTYDQFITFAPIPLLGWNHISLMCLLMTISTLVYTYFNNQVSGAQGQMKYIGYITPLIFFGVLNSYPAGLNYYYFCANILTFSQQYFIRKFVDDDKIHAQIQENKKKPESEKKKGGWQKKMEDMMRQQQQVNQQKKK